MPSAELDILLECYMLRGFVEVKVFLDANPFLIPILLQAHPVIRRCFSSTTQAVLEVVHDPEGGAANDELFVFIQTAEEAEEALAKLDRLDREWWIDASEQVQCRMTISVEYV